MIVHYLILYLNKYNFHFFCSIKDVYILYLSKGDELFNSKARKGYCENFNLGLLNLSKELAFPATRVYLTAYKTQKNRLLVALLQ